MGSIGYESRSSQQDQSRLGAHSVALAAGLKFGQAILLGVLLAVGGCQAHDASLSLGQKPLRLPSSISRTRLDVPPSQTVLWAPGSSGTDEIFDGHNSVVV
jgi:hypothetical protein